eukprot:SAG31_NODE_1165_length_9578_cov_5.386011_9_plen_160_part_00
MDDEPEAEKLCTESMSDGIGQDRINSSANASAPTLFDPRKVVTLEEIAARTPSTTTVRPITYADTITAVLQDVAWLQDGQPDNRPGSDGTSQDDDYIPDMEDFEDASLMIDDEVCVSMSHSGVLYQIFKSIVFSRQRWWCRTRKLRPRLSLFSITMVTT